MNIAQVLATEFVQGARPLPDSPIQRVAVFAEAFLPKVDGVSRSALLTARYLRATGRAVIIFAPNPTLSNIDDMPVIGIPSLPMPTYPETRIAPVWPGVFTRLNRFKPDLIHLFSPFGLGAAGMLAGAWLDVPVIANYQTDLPAYAHSYGFGFLEKTFIDALRFLHNGCTLTLAPSAATRAQLRGWGFHRLRQWERGIDTERFDPARHSTAWRARLLNGRDPSRLVVLYVGRMARDKHIDTLLALADRPEIALTLVGTGSYQPELEQVFAATDAFFAGPLLGDDLAAAYASADCFVFPGPEETFGQVVLEALASGLPAIVANRGGPPTLIRDGVNGFICPVDDGAAFADRVAVLYLSPERRAAMGAAARAYALTRPWIAIMGQLEGFYAEALRLDRKRVQLRTVSG